MTRIPLIPRPCDCTADRRLEANGSQSAEQRALYAIRQLLVIERPGRPPRAVPIVGSGGAEIPHPDGRVVKIASGRCGPGRWRRKAKGA